MRASARCATASTCSKAIAGVPANEIFHHLRSG
jgi:hypothetical protein